MIVTRPTPDEYAPFYAGYVAALLYIIPGHVQHHVEVLRTRYGIGRPGP